MLITGASLRLQSTPTLVERFSGAQICTSELDFSISSAYQSLEMIKLKRIGNDEERDLKKRQEEKLKKNMLNKKATNCADREEESNNAVSKDDGAEKATNCVDKEESNDAVSKDDGAEKIRAARKQRLQPEANQEVGVKVRVATPGGQLTRYFSQGGAYQEVYDWLGSDSNNPLYFIVENFDKDIMSPNQPIKHQNQILRLVEMSKQELTERFGGSEEVVFKGTIPASTKADDSTIINEELSENMTRGGEQGKNESKEDHERRERLKAEKKALKRRQRKLRLKEARRN